MKYGKIAEEICGRDDPELGAVLGDVDFCIAVAASWLKQYDEKKFHCEKSLEARLRKPDDFFALGIIYNEISCYYSEKGLYEQAVEACNKASQVYDNIEIYKSGKQMAMRPRLIRGLQYLYLGRIEEAEMLVNTCLEFLRRPGQWDFNETR